MSKRYRVPALDSIDLLLRRLCQHDLGWTLL
jgi:hypothetical protein